MVSKASEDLPDPDSPVKTIRALRGRSRLTFLRLCSRAPRMTRRSMALRVLPSSVSGICFNPRPSAWSGANRPSHCKRPPDNDCSRPGYVHNVHGATDQEACMAEFDRAHVEPGGPLHRYPGGPPVVTKLSVGPFDNNAYLLADPETGEALLVDAANEAERLLELLNGVKLVGIVTTHRHPDHIQALTAVLKVHDVWSGAHPADADEIAALVGVRPDRLLEHGATIKVGRFDVGVLHTPGHTEGSISFELPSGQV